MEIGPLPNDKPLNGYIAREPARQDAPGHQNQVTDKVEISDNARARLAELADAKLNEHHIDREIGNADVNEPATGGTPSRLDEIREKIESGFYDRPEVKNEVARRLADDLDI